MSPRTTWTPLAISFCTGWRWDISLCSASNKIIITGKTLVVSFPLSQLSKIDGCRLVKWSRRRGIWRSTKQYLEAALLCGRRGSNDDGEEISATVKMPGLLKSGGRKNLSLPSDPYRKYLFHKVWQCQRASETWANFRPAMRQRKTFDQEALPNSKWSDYDDMTIHRLQLVVVRSTIRLTNRRQ